LVITLFPHLFFLSFFILQRVLIKLVITLFPHLFFLSFFTSSTFGFLAQSLEQVDEIHVYNPSGHGPIVINQQQVPSKK